MQQGDGPGMAATAIVTSSASDLTPELAASRGVIVVPSTVSFGAQEFAAEVDLSTAEFWERMLAPDSPYPITAPPSPGAFKQAYETAFASGASGIVSIQMGSHMSATMNSARVAAQMFSDRDIRVVDTGSASMATGLLALIGADMAAAGGSPAEIAGTLVRLSVDVHLFAALDTFEYLRRGGRTTESEAGSDTSLSVKPVITIEDGEVRIIDRVRTRHQARERVVELLTRRPAEWLAIMYSPPADGEAFMDTVVQRMPGVLNPSHVIVYPVGVTIGPHVGPDCLGGVVISQSGAD